MSSTTIMAIADATADAQLLAWAEDRADATADVMDAPSDWDAGTVTFDPYI